MVFIRDFKWKEGMGLHRTGRIWGTMGVAEGSISWWAAGCSRDKSVAVTNHRPEERPIYLKGMCTMAKREAISG